MTTRHHRWTKSARARAGFTAGALAALAVAVLVPGVQPRADATGNPLAGSQGTDTALPLTSSAVTVDGNGLFPGLKVTVNQTQNLGNQAVSVSWTGGTPTDSGPGVPFDGTYNENFLQIFECWGDPTTDAGATGPGPSPSQCEFGGESTSSTSYPIQDVGFQYSRVLAQSTWSSYSQMSGYTDPKTGYVIEPFDAVDGTVVNQQANYSWDQNVQAPTAFWLNPYFSFDNTNEIDFARTYADGTGEQEFQVDTGLEAPGLGCGQNVQASTTPNGSPTVPQCWLVIVPRGTMAQENPSNVTGVDSVVTSPLNPVAWSNRIAIPLGFKPVGSSCAIGGNEQRIVGSELATSAVSSWQPALCSTPGAPPYNYSYVPDDQARQDIVQPSFGGAGMAVFSDPIATNQTDPSNPVVYAPLTLSGVVIGFNIERTPALVGSSLQPDELALSGIRVQNLFLTPRLVAKLLTESYKSQLEDVATDKSSAYAWIKKNATSLVTDPDFLQYNPEFSLLTTQEQLDAASLVVEESSADAATKVWNWILADPEAKAWLNGQPDPWGMVVNPLYSTNPAINPSGQAFASTTLNSYPKSDPYCFNTGDTVFPIGSPPEPARPICLQDWSPYALTMQAAAQAAASSNDGGKTTLNPGGNADSAWSANGPQPNGSSFILSITDSASAAQYGLQTASLSRSGDDSPTRAFVAPDQQGLLTGEQAMVPSATPGVLVGNPATTVPGAYPLTMLTYAAATPLTLDPTSRQNYATFLKYAAGAGQTPGVELGQLPPGYAPLPADLRSQTLAAAATIVNPPSPASTPAPTPTSSTTATPFPANTSVASLGVGSDNATTGSSTPPASADRRHPVTKHIALATLHTSPFTAGGVRWALPIGLIVGLTAGLVAPFVRRPRRRKLSPDGVPPKPKLFETW